MADRKISALSALAITDVAGATDFLAINDVSEVDALENKRIIVNDLLHSGWQGARMSRATNLTPGAGDQVISFTSEDIDTDGLINIGSDATKIIIPAGWRAVRINGHARLTASFTPLYIQFKINGGFITGAQGGGDMGATAEALAITSHYVAVTGGDFIQLNVFTVGAKTLSNAFLGVERLA